MSIAPPSLSLLAIFHVGGALFAFDAQAVQEVIRHAAVTTVPHAPAEVKGVINLRGKIVTLLDTGLILGLASASVGPHSRVFIIEDQAEFFGLLVDRVGDVVEMDAAAMEPVPLHVPPSQASFCVGVSRSAGRVITLLKTKELLAAHRSSATAGEMKPTTRNDQ